MNAVALRKPPAWLLASTPILLLLTHYAAVLLHEFSHSILAWILGIKDQPGNITWGGTSLLNILLLINIDENVDYTAALEAGKNWQVAAVAFAGPGLANLWDYVPIRVFAADSDVAHFRWGTGLSPWAIIDFYRVVLPFSLDEIRFGRDGRTVVLIVATALMFAYFSIPGLLESDDMSQLIACTGLMAVPVIIILQWRRIVDRGGDPSDPQHQAA